VIAGVTAQPEHRLEDFGLMAPMLVYALVLSLFMASASVAVS
jgi:hypothetical protein